MITYMGLGSAGRLGNQLFQLASCMGIARKNKHTYCFPTWNYSSYFEAPIPQCPLEFLKPDLVAAVEQCHYLDINIPEKYRDKVMNIQGYLQTEKYFKGIINVSHYFKPNEVITKYIDNKYGDIFLGETCSIHVRRTDYINLQDHHPLCTVDYYEQAIKLIDKPRLRFLVFSDDINWCKQIFKGVKFIFIEDEKDIVDLFLMSRCNNHIIANSSFSWWGAWLNDNSMKRVIAPKTWFGKEYAHYNQDDIIPKEWIKI